MPSLLNTHADERVHPRSQHQTMWFGHSTAAGMGAYHPGPQLGAGGKAAVPRVPSMLFEMEMEESMQSSHADDASGSLHELRRYLLPLSTGEYKLRAEVEVAVARQQQQQQLQEQPPPDSMLDACHRLATHLSRKGYHVHVRQSLGGGDGFECLRNLRHVFLTVLPPGAHATTNRYIVDLSFKEQFRVAKPTPRYQALLECLPEVYVAPEAMVAPLVHLMCQEMALAFQANGAVLPPWREGKSMITRWNPRKSCDLAFPPLPHTALPAPALGAAGQKVLPPLPGVGKHPLLQQQEVRARIQEVLDAAVVDAVCKQQQAAVAGGIKPIACEPQRVMVGGNFSTVGFQ